MNQPADDKAAVLRERLDQLASNVSGGDDLDGAQLYRQGVRRRRRRIAVTAGLVAAAVVAAGAAIGSAVQPEASPDPSTPAPSNGCDIPVTWAPALEAGALTEQKACQELQPGEQEIPTASGIMHTPEGRSLAIESWVHADMVQQCRSGSYPIGEDYQAAELYCNAILKIAAGELEPTHICEPPECSKPELIWSYDEAQLRDLLPTSSGCQLSDTLKELVELGEMTRKQACHYVKQGERARYAREHPEEFPGGALVVEGYAHADLVADCRAGRTITSEHNDITCNALIMIAEGELEPNDTCGPPGCPEEGTPLWRYTVPELRELARQNK